MYCDNCACGVFRCREFHQFYGWCERITGAYTIEEMVMERTPYLFLEETVFRPDNIGPDCDLIANYMARFCEEYIEPALSRGDFEKAVELYVQLLRALTDHYIADEHWCYYDDFYSPDYEVKCIWDKFIPYIRSGAITDDIMARLEESLAMIEKTEAYQNYGIPSMIPFGNLRVKP